MTLLRTFPMDLMATLPGSPVADHPAEPILRIVGETFELLAQLHSELNSAEAPKEAVDHVASATRELAAIQRMFERRGNR